MVEWVRAHTGGTNLESIMNDEADKIAYKAHVSGLKLNWPTMYLDNYTLYSAEHGYVEYSPATLIERSFNEHAVQSLSFGTREMVDHRIPKTSNIAPPKCLYTYSTKAHSVQAQSCIRSHTLNTDWR